jgi:FkbH-like protein
MTALKCVIWDLDDTLWRGILAEGDHVHGAPEALALVERLEHAGIVQSVASKNDPTDAAAALSAHGLSDVFVYPQISWAAKSAGVRRITELLNVGAESVVLLDDSPFERAEVAAAVPGLRCYSLQDFLADDARHHLVPRRITEEAAQRPQAYRAEARRRAAETAFAGPAPEFLASLEMVLSVRLATADDLDRAAELTERTNQLNTTGRTFGPAELARFAASPSRHVLMAKLRDRFGDYGRIGLCLLYRAEDHWSIELFLMSCRVMGRNVGSALLGVVAGIAASDHVPLRALYRPTGRNRRMRITYALHGFVAVDTRGDTVVLAHDHPAQISVPGYVDVVVDPRLAAPSRRALLHDRRPEGDT